MSLLIVNADDFGATDGETESVLTLADEGVVSSATAMVWMRASDRAASCAEDANAPAIGLHINLSSAFTDASTPRPVRDRHEKALALFRNIRLRRIVWSPRVRGAVDAAIRDQLERFQELFGRAPTHFDGHHHVHISPNVFLSSALPTGSLMRTTLVAAPRRPLAEPVRRIRRAIAATRLRMPAGFLDLGQLVRLPGEDAVSAIRACRTPVELMVHPAEATESAFLRLAEVRSVLAQKQIVTYPDLSEQATP